MRHGCALSLASEVGTAMPSPGADAGEYGRSADARGRPNEETPLVLCHTDGAEMETPPVLSHRRRYWDYMQ